MISIIKRISIAPFFVFFLFLLSVPADAFIVSPAIKKLYVKPGEQVIEIVAVTNETNKTIILSPMVENFKPKDTKGMPEFLGDMDTEGAARWIQLPFKKVTLAPRERKDFLFKINIPPWATPGGHYAALFWNTQQDAREGVGSVSRVGSLFLFGVEGAITGKAVMSNARVVKNKNGGVEGFSYTLTNISNIHVEPQGSIEVYNFFGRRVAELPLNVSKSNVLAHSERVFFEPWKKPFVSWGKLRARVRSEFDFGLPAQEQMIIFYNLPRFAGVKILVGALFALFIIRKIYKKKQLSKEHKLILGS
ncbi:MAG: hypothetical protein HY981_00770 [Candidatus Magasanikbacteria bacterium]|nr:hypothetical protein [Candidatus Magasanikbacteria bacterium]